MSDLESMFGCPVVEAYGMTEASHQMACNPLPPGVRKPGSVGPAAGPEVAIMDEVHNDAFLPAGVTGEITIRGANVTQGYSNNSEANEKAFTPQGWFRTGDQGYMDEDGYVFITGRLKEIINRGGEKISPREIDEVLLDHPGVKQALAFAMPHETLGEDVAAAVVLSDTSLNEGQLRRFTAEKLADFKVPQRIVILDEIPKGATGKLQRIGLAEKLGVKAEPEKTAPPTDQIVPPRTEAESVLAELWQEVLNLPEVSVFHRFLELGGDSITATQLLTKVHALSDWLELTRLFCK
jgi:acyl-CoA synthetase (AMP-forming)/AMP-acid ligase II